MNVIELLAKAAQQNHGRQLDPPAVKEVLMTLQTQQQQYLASQGRLDAVTRVAGVMLERLGGTITMQPEELEAFADGPGFNVEWNEETDVVHVDIAVEDVEMPEVSEDDETAADSDLRLAPVPEDGAEEVSESETGEE